MLGLAAALLALGGLAELRRGPGGSFGIGAVGALLRGDGGPGARNDPRARIAGRLALRSRIERAGLSGRLDPGTLLAAKGVGVIAGAVAGVLAAPAAPGRLSLLVALAMPAAGFVAPDALLERRARLRALSLRGSLPDALDLLATAAAAGRSPLSGMAEIAEGDGALARELSMLVAETSCGASQSEALEELRRRVPAQELAAMCGVLERSRRYGSPLAEQLHEQASSMRGAQRRRIGEHAAKAAPKIQLAVALLLVPSVLLMIAAGLLANVDRFIAGI
jgi:tight adherence protein C